MAAGKFKFGAQPALDKAKAEQADGEQALAGAIRALTAQREQLEQCEQALEKTRQQIRGEHDKLMSAGESADGGASPADLAGRSGFIDRLRERQAQQAQALNEQRQEVRFAEEKVVLRKHELSEAMAAVKGLEKFKERQQKEFQAAANKAEEREREDFAILHGSRKPPGSKA